jgi:hypothetical protein
MSGTRLTGCLTVWNSGTDASVFTSVAKPYHLYAAPAPSEIFDSAPAALAPQQWFLPRTRGTSMYLPGAYAA